MITLFTDGSCYVASHTGGYASLIAFEDGSRKLIFGGAHATSIERMELTAVIEGLRYIRQYFADLIKQTGTQVHVTLVNDREDLLRQISGEYGSKHNHDLWAAFKAVSDGMRITPIWTTRNIHPAQAMVDKVCGDVRILLEGVNPTMLHEVSAVDISVAGLLQQAAEERFIAPGSAIPIINP